MATINIAGHRPALGLIGTGAILWIAGLLVIALLPLFASIGAVLVLVGQILFWLGIIVLVVELLFSLFRGV